MENAELIDTVRAINLTKSPLYRIKAAAKGYESVGHKVTAEVLNSVAEELEELKADKNISAIVSLILNKTNHVMVLNRRQIIEGILREEFRKI